MFKTLLGVAPLFGVIWATVYLLSIVYEAINLLWYVLIYFFKSRDFGGPFHKKGHYIKMCFLNIVFFWV